MHRHVITGITAALELRKYLREPLEQFCIFEDHLVLGALSPLDDIESFISLRSDFWRDNSYDDYKFIGFALEEFISRIKEADSYTIWLAPGAHDQIFWAWLICLLEILEKDFKKLQIKHLLNKQDNLFPYVTLGEIEAKDYVLCSDLKIESAHIAALREAYEALVSTSPEKLLTVCNKQISPLPALQKSLQSYLYLYPNIHTGLTIVEKALLSGCKEGSSKTARVIGEAMISETYYNSLAIGDSYLFRQLVKLSQKECAVPLVSIHGEIRDAYSMRSTEVSLTEQGKSVLSGQSNQVELNGLDMRIGGVHLCSKNNEPLWFYDNGALKQTAPPT